MDAPQIFVQRKNNYSEELMRQIILKFFSNVKTGLKK